MSRDPSHHVLIAGGGVAALEAALALRELGAERLTVELLAPESVFWYRALSVAEPFEQGQARRFELSALAEAAGASHTLGAIDSVDVERRLAYTAAGATIPYGALLLACGAKPTTAVEGALTFRGPADVPAVRELLTELEQGAAKRVAFAVPAGAVWSLPACELALMTASWAANRGIADVHVTLVTPEEAPLALFGREASDEVTRVLEEAGVAVVTRTQPAEARVGELLVVLDDVIPADRVVALPRLCGPRIGGIPQTYAGFVPVDAHGRVLGLDGVYAAGDITVFPLKQGGIATQQADAAAEAIAADLGLDVDARPFRPILRGLLLTGREPRYLRADVEHDAAEGSQASPEPLWWPPAKVVGHHLAPFLARFAGAGTLPPPPEYAGVEVDVELDQAALEQRVEDLIEQAVGDALDERSARRVGEVMTGDPLLVAPEDTLGEVAEQMHARDVASALVVEHGRLAGIITARDMLHALAARLHSSEARVRSWMTVDPITVSKSSPLPVAARLMSEFAVHHLPVVDGERPVGMVGLRDVVAGASDPGTPARL